MKVRYDGLNFLLDSYGMTRSDLVTEAGLTFNVITSIGKNEPIPTSAIVKLCQYFLCDISDIMNFVFEDSEKTQAKLSAFREQLKRKGRDDIEVVLDEKYPIVVFFYTGQKNVRDMLMSVSLDTIPMRYSRREMIEAVAPLVEYACNAADSKKMDLEN